MSVEIWNLLPATHLYPATLTTVGEQEEGAVGILFDRQDLHEGAHRVVRGGGAVGDLTRGAHKGDDEAWVLTLLADANKPLVTLLKHVQWDGHSWEDHGLRKGKQGQIRHASRYQLPRGMLLGRHHMIRGARA